jgi:GntR family transcriptional regulator/MocR family aminotransferase
MTNFTLILDFNTNIPLYEQLYQYITTEIKSGNLRPNEKLPSKRSLANHLGVSQNTVIAAYDMLIDEGYLVSKERSGFYVSPLDANAFPAIPDIKLPTPTTSNNPLPTKYKYDFNTNLVDTTFFPYKTWTKITKDIMYNDPTLLNHGDPQGDECLRDELAKYLHEFRGVNCKPSQIIIGAGIEYLLGIIFHILGKSSFAFENPGYYKTYKIAQNNNVPVNLIELDDEGMSVTKLSASKSSVAYITPSHQFPMGIIMPIKRRLELLKWANESLDRFIIEDDYDSEFRFNGRPIPSLQGIDNHNKVIYLSTFSKSIAPSIRIAYMVLPEQLLDIYKRDFHYYSSTVSRFEQNCLYQFIRDGHFSRHINRMRNIYRSRKDKLIAELKVLPNQDKIEIVGENAGLHLLLKIKNGMTELSLLESAKKVGIKLYGLSNYFIDGNPTIDNTVVLGFSNIEIDDIAVAVKLLNNVWFTNNTSK